MILLENIKKIPYILPVLINRHKLKKGYKGPKDLCLITNNCVGGVISHELGLKFYSPTINIHFSEKDYLNFIKNLNYYLSKNVEKKLDNDKPYPVGILKGDRTHKTILINFVHFKNFDAAKAKWEERKKRINRHVVFILDAKIISNELYQFASLCKSNPSYFLITYESIKPNKDMLKSKFGNIKFLKCKNPMDGMLYNINGKEILSIVNIFNILINFLILEKKG